MRFALESTRFQGRPIFICGWPRTGTRMVANLIASHPDVPVPDEIQGSAIRALLEALAAIDGTLGEKARIRDHWEAIRQDYFLNAIFNTYKTRDHGSAIRFCNKTPVLEQSYQGIDDACRSARPLYLFLRQASAERLGIACDHVVE